MKLNKKGFTLIELVIVIIIIAILAAVAIPRFRDLAYHARTASERATVTAVRQAIAIYRAYNELEGITPVFPTRLDDSAADVNASDIELFFEEVMEPGGEIRSGWSKGMDVNIYIGPAGGVFVYISTGANAGSFVP